ncbi:MAG: hypothetical protein QXY52_01275 [Conexivisphaerales archaeon]
MPGTISHKRKYLTDMQNAIRRALEVAYEMAIRDHNRIPSPIALRKAVKPWFVSNYDYAIHHLNPVVFLPLPCSGHIRRTIMAS